MAHLIVKDLPDGLVQELRELAESRGQTIKACVTFLIRQATDPRHAVVERAVQHARPSHDPKTCRIYGCLVCKEMDA